MEPTEGASYDELMRGRSLVTATLLLGFAVGDGARAAEPTAPVAVKPSVSPARREFVRLNAALRPELRSNVESAARTLLGRLMAQEEARKKDPRLSLLPADAMARKVVDEAGHFGLTTRAESDIELLAHLVLLQAARDAEEDLAALKSRIAAINALKRCKNDRACMRDVRASAEVRQVDLDSIRAKALALENSQDSLNEMGEMESLRLQLYMDRISKLMSTLSNILKKISDTSTQIVQNLK